MQRSLKAESTWQAVLVWSKEALGTLPASTKAHFQYDKKLFPEETQVKFLFPSISWTEQIALELSIEGDSLLRVVNWDGDPYPNPMAFMWGQEA